MLRRLIILIVALHSIVLGVAMVADPAAVLTLVGWSYQGPRFFPAQSGVFLFLLGIAYLGGLRWSPAAWFLVVSKAVAVVFLVGHVALGLAPPVALLAAVLDGAMGAALAVVLVRERDVAVDAA